MEDRLAEAHPWLGTVLLNYEWDRSGAERELRRAMELNPNDADAYQVYASHLSELGRLDEAMAAMKRARELDPLSLNISTNVGMFFYFAHQYDQAIEQYRKTIELDPNFPRAHIWLGLAYERKGRYDEALAEFRKAATLDPNSTEAVAALGHAYAQLGQRGEAQKRVDALKELSKQRYVPPYRIALIYTGLGEKDHAFAWLEKAYEARDEGIIYALKPNPLWDSLRSDPRFADLLRRFRFPP